MREKPKILVSRCLTFDNCRYDGGIVQDDFIEKLKEYVNFITVCPEVEIGLGIPRKWLSLVNDKEEGMILYQKSTGKDFTADIKKYAKKISKEYNDADGFILKGRSPSCGIKDVKYYPSKDSNIKSGTSTGIFTSEIFKLFPTLPVESEGRLRSFKIRENFLTKLYTVFRFKSVLESKKMKDLVKFHSQHKFLFQSFSDEGMRKLGKICANHKKNSAEKTIEEYYNHLFLVFKNERKYTLNINVLEHCFGFISQNLKSTEKEYFFQILKQYREGHLPLSVPIKLLNGWIIRYEEDYLLDQYYFKPYPYTLMDIKDSGKGRNF